MACSEEEPGELRFATPKSTVDTLLDTYGVLELPQEEIDRRMRIGRNFHLNDPETMARCFSDYDGSDPAAEGLVGYVFGNLAYAKDELFVTVTGETADVFAERDGERSRPVVLHLQGSNWKISLRDSVPSSVRRRLETAASEGVDGHVVDP